MKVSRLTTSKFVGILHIGGAAIITTTMAIMGRVSLETMTCYQAMYYNGNLVFTHPPAILGTVTFLFTLHVLKIRRLRQSQFARNFNNKSSIRRINIVIYIIMFLFIICQMPFIINDILQLLVDLEVLFLSDYFFKILYNVAIVFYLLNHAVNPYIYFISYLCFKKRSTIAPLMTQTSQSNPSSYRSTALKTVNNQTNRLVRC